MFSQKGESENMNFGLIDLVKLFDPSYRFHDQFYYGNREVLLDYLFLPRNLIVLGSIQHGFNPNPGKLKKLKLANGKTGVHYLWTTPKQSSTRSDIRAIGATWLYFLERQLQEVSWFHIEKTKPLRLPDVPKCIGYIPAKLGTSQCSNSMMHQRNAENLRNKFSSATRIKVLLDARDMLSNKTRLAYTSLGIEIYCNGWNGSFLINGKMGDERIRTDFYQELFDFLQSVDCVVSDSFGSHLLYSLSISVPVRIIQRLNTSDLLLHEFKEVASDYIAHHVENEKRAAELFPGMFTEHQFDQTQWREMALRTLGIEEYLAVRHNLREELLLKRIRTHYFVARNKAIMVN